MSFRNPNVKNQDYNTVNAEVIIETSRYADLKYKDFDYVIRFADNKIELGKFSNVMLIEDGLVVENPDIVFQLDDIEKVIVSIANKLSDFEFITIPEQDVFIRVEIAPKDEEHVVVLLDALIAAIPIMSWLKKHHINFVDEGDLCEKITITDDIEKRIKEIAQNLDDDDTRYLYNYTK